MGKLYLVAVPIGNLEEITYLGFRTLRDTKVIFCEDTRVTRHLLDLLKIWNNQELIKLNQFNEKECVELVMSKLSKEDCVLVSDAGYPIISDPGYFLVSDLRKRRVNIQVINGPCAFVHAIVSSGIDSRRIFFASFLTKKYLQRKKELENFKSILKEATIIYYETKNFIPKGLEIIQEVYGDIHIGVGRELSKLNETFYYDKVSKIREQLVVQGEFVVIIPRQDSIALNTGRDIEEVLEIVHARMFNKREKLRDICKELSESEEFSTKEIYKGYCDKYKS